VNDSPNSSAPSTPNDEQQGHRRTGSVTLGGEDYFMSALRFRSDSKSVPSTPQGTVKRSATFSPRIQFHDTWPSGEYDRRGEIATCNRLTPTLAQQIKEELNTFKMVCLVIAVILNILLTWCTGNGSTRKLQNIYTLLLMKLRLWLFTQPTKPTNLPLASCRHIKKGLAHIQTFKGVD
jgi:hypothetical protein